jgi:hypothetical protein
MRCKIRRSKTCCKIFWSPVNIVGCYTGADKDSGTEYEARYSNIEPNLSKIWHLCTKLHGVASQNIGVFFKHY